MITSEEIIDILIGLAFFVVGVLLIAYAINSLSKVYAIAVSVIGGVIAAIGVWLWIRIFTE